MSFLWSNQRVSDTIQKLPNVTSSSFSICKPCLLSFHWTVIHCHYHRLCRYCFGSYMWRQQLDPFCKQNCPHFCLHSMNVSCSLSFFHTRKLPECWSCMRGQTGAFTSVCYLTACWCFSHNTTYLSQTPCHIPISGIRSEQISKCDWQTVSSETCWGLSRGFVDI